MNKGIKQLVSIVTVGLFLPLYASSAIALNPQPEPPGIQQNSESSMTQMNGDANTNQGNMHHQKTKTEKSNKSNTRKNHNVIQAPKGSDMSSDSSTS